MEFDLIHRHFKLPFEGLSRANSRTVVEGIGDDCATFRMSPDHLMYTSTDTLVEGVHFFAEDAPEHIGWKSLACNLSDLAASGAEPLGFMLNLSLPRISESWLSGFSSGLLQLASRFNCPLLGGDTTSAGANSAITISITVFGQAPLAHHGFHRSHACVGDEVWVSGLPGLARLGLLLEYHARNQLAACCDRGDLQTFPVLLSRLSGSLQLEALQALRQPVPQLQWGGRLQGVANACIDLSDGLGGDLSHITQASSLSAVLSVPALKSLWLEKWPDLPTLPDANLLLDSLVRISLQGGDDFQLCWTAPAHSLDAIILHSDQAHCIGHLQHGEGIWLDTPGQSPARWVNQSYDHFRGVES